MLSVEWCLTRNPDFKVTPLFDAEYLRNGTWYRHSYNEILMGTYTVPYSKMSFRMTFSDLEWAKYTMTRSIARPLYHSWTCIICMSEGQGCRGYGDSHGYGYGMGIRIKIQSPRQPCWGVSLGQKWGAHVPPTWRRLYQSLFCLFLIRNYWLLYVIYR